MPVNTPAHHPLQVLETHLGYRKASARRRKQSPIEPATRATPGESDASSSSSVASTGTSTGSSSIDVQGIMESEVPGSSGVLLESSTIPGVAPYLRESSQQLQAKLAALGPECLEAVCKALHLLGRSQDALAVAANCGDAATSAQLLQLLLQLWGSWWQAVTPGTFQSALQLAVRLGHARHVSTLVVMMSERAGSRALVDALAGGKAAKAGGTSLAGAAVLVLVGSGKATHWTVARELLQLCADSPKRLPLQWDTVLAAAAAGTQNRRLAISEVVATCKLALQELLPPPTAATQAAVQSAAAQMLRRGQLEFACELVYRWHSSVEQQSRALWAQQGGEEQQNVLEAAAPDSTAAAVAEQELLTAAQLVQQLLPDLAVCGTLQSLSLDELAAALQAWQSQVQHAASSSEGGSGSSRRVTHVLRTSAAGFRHMLGLVLEGVVAACRLMQGKQTVVWARQLSLYQQVSHPWCSLRCALQQAQCTSTAACCLHTASSTAVPLHVSSISA